MTSRTSRAATLVVLGALVTLAGCSTEPTAPAASSAGTTAEPVRGGTLRYALQADPQCLDPRQGGLTVSLTVTRSVVDSLLDQDPATGEIAPWLAESWEVNDDATEFTYHLRDDVTFSDGEPLTAELVKANLDNTFELGALAGLPAQYLTGYVETRVDDERTATVVFAAPNAQFLQASSSMSLGLLSTASLERTPEELCAGDYAASGPFVVDEFVPAQSVSLSRRDGYDWAPARAAHEGEAWLDAIEFTVAPEASVRSGSLLSGQVDVIGDVPAQDVARLEDQGFQKVSRPNPGSVGGLLVNATRPALQDVDVRTALQSAVDRETVAETLFFGTVEPATSPLSSSTPGWADVSELVAYDPDAARDALDEAGWVEGADGVREKDGERLTLSASWNPAIGWGAQVLELVQQQLSEVGVELELRPITPAELSEVLTARDYDLFYNSQTRPDPDVLWGNYSPDNPSNRHGDEDPELASVLAEQRTTTDPDVRWPLVRTAQERILTDGFIVPVVESVSVLGAAPTVHGIDWEASSKPVLYDIWLEEE